MREPDLNKAVKVAQDHLLNTAFGRGGWLSDLQDEVHQVDELYGGVELLSGRSIDVRQAVTKALPYIRLHIAQEIRAEEITKEHAPDQDFREGVMLGMEHAAQIVEGPQQ